MQHIQVLQLDVNCVWGVLLHSLDSVSAAARVPGSLHEFFNRSSLQEDSRQRRVRRGVGRICVLTAMVNKYKLGWVAHPYTPQDDFNGSREARGGIQSEATLEEEFPLLQDVIDAMIRALVAVACHHCIQATGT